MLKDWKKSKDVISSRGIYGINGNYIWVNKNNPRKVIELQKVMGGGTSIHYHRGDGYIETIPESGIGFKHRTIALRQAKKWMSENN